MFHPSHRPNPLRQRQGFVALEVAPGVDADALAARTGAPITLAPDCREI